MDKSPKFDESGAWGVFLAGSMAILGSHATCSPPTLSVSLLSNPILHREGGVWAMMRNDALRAKYVVRIAGDRVEMLHHSNRFAPSEFRYVDAEGGIWFSARTEGWWRHHPSGGLRLEVNLEPGMEANLIQVGPEGQQWRTTLPLNWREG